MGLVLNIPAAARLLPRLLGHAICLRSPAALPISRAPLPLHRQLRINACGALPRVLAQHGRGMHCGLSLAQPAHPRPRPHVLVVLPKPASRVRISLQAACELPRDCAARRALCRPVQLAARQFLEQRPGRSTRIDAGRPTRPPPHTPAPPPALLAFAPHGPRAACATLLCLQNSRQWRARACAPTPPSVAAACVPPF